ncbi:MAG: hypothetical protein ABH834_06595 [Candidatus Altiarchaeota archaeon]
MSDKPVVDKKFNEDVNVSEQVADGAVLSTLYLEVQGNNKETAKKALEKTVFEKMLSEEYVTLLEARLFEIKKDEKADYYSGVAEVKVLARDFRWFINTVMRYGPSAIEILEPEEYHLSSDEMHSLVADVSEIVHAYTTQIMSFLRDEERVALYNKFLKKEE